MKRGFAALSAAVLAITCLTGCADAFRPYPDERA